MAVTEEQKRRAIEILDRLTEKEVDTILASETSFIEWLKNVAEDIYVAIFNAVSDIWNWLQNIFT